MSYPSDYDNSGRQPHPSGYRHPATQQQSLGQRNRHSHHHTHQHVAPSGRHDHPSAHAGYVVQYPAQVGNPNLHRVVATPSHRSPSIQPPPSDSRLPPSHSAPFDFPSSQSAHLLQIDPHRPQPPSLDMYQLSRQPPLAYQAPPQPTSAVVEQLSHQPKPTLRQVIRTRLEAAAAGTFGEVARTGAQLDTADIDRRLLGSLSANLARQLSGRGDESSLHDALKGVLGVGIEGPRFQLRPTAQLDLAGDSVVGGTPFADTTIQATYADIHGPAMQYKRDKNSRDDDETKRKRHNIPAIVKEKYADLVVDMALAAEDSGETWDDVLEYWSDVSGSSTADRPKNSGIRLVDQCIMATTTTTAPVTRWWNSVTEIESLPSKNTAAQRAIKVREHYRKGLCQALAYLIGAWEICGGYLGAVFIGTRFSRLMMADHETIFLEIGEPSPFKWDETSWSGHSKSGNNNSTTIESTLKAPQVKTLGTAFPPSIDLGSAALPDRKRTRLWAFLGHLTAGPDQLAHDLVKGWVPDANGDLVVELDTHELQTFLDVFNAGMLDVADHPTNQPLTKTLPSPLTCNHVLQDLSSANAFTIRPRYDKIEIMRRAGPVEFAPYIQAIYAEAKTAAAKLEDPKKKKKEKRRKVPQSRSGVFGFGRRSPSPDAGAGSNGPRIIQGLGRTLASYQGTSSGAGRTTRGGNGGAGGTAYMRSTGPMEFDDITEPPMAAAPDSPMDVAAESFIDDAEEPSVDAPQSPMDEDDAHHSDAVELGPDDSVSCAGDSESDNDEWVEDILMRLPFSVVLVTRDEMEAAIIERVLPHPAPVTPTSLSPGSARDSILETPNTPHRLPETQDRNSKSHQEASDQRPIQRTTRS